MGPQLLADAHGCGTAVESLWRLWEVVEAVEAVKVVLLQRVADNSQLVTSRCVSPHELATRTPTHKNTKSLTQRSTPTATMHGSSCPKCGAASSGSSNRAPTKCHRLVVSSQGLRGIRPQ
ncbi:hypothetical protein B0H67DRAFT_365396 [Lasiosphaeris hirsuta]|uniref:Uncharacterized protein n=1 Tax=Lasiosphaeris hirsuta TaxID=260670 RepID=A0AA39ZWL3_9PEZI|nr:hypothetical protein B0H67DRAFT_365396 [Lasiosphaeris hirsuta]